ncbi:MAG: TonB-dependent receptor [Chitinophagaceae bacterium]|nr:TonB-dependent receptor [Chitinophagaceae bacterium]
MRQIKFFSIFCFLYFIFFPGIHLSAAARDTPAGGSLSGRVTEKDKGVGVPGASVYIADLKLGVISDSAGYYKFNSLPSGSYLVEVRSIGLKAVTLTVSISGPVTRDFVLTDQYVEESPVVVTGLSKATQIKRSPVPIVAVDHQYIATNLSTNIIDAIAKVPGVSALTTGPNVSKPFIRGLGYNRILSLYDGVRQEGQQWGDEHGIEVDQYGVDRIEVIKGPASLTYGSDALAGVVNLIPTPAAPEGRIVGNVQAEYQTNNGLFGGSAMLGATKNGFEWMGRISHKQATNYQNKVDGRVFNTAFNETDANLSLGLHRGWGYSHLSLSLFDDLQEIPDGGRDSATGKFTQTITEAGDVRIVSDADLKSYSMTPLHQHVQHYRAYLTNNFILGNSRLAVNLGFQRSVRREFSHPEVPYQKVAGLYLQLNTYSYDVKYYLPEFDGWNLALGVNGMYQDNNVAKGTEFVIPSYHQFDVGPFALLKKTFGKLDISGGARFDSRSFKNFQLYTKPNPVTGFEMPVYGADTAGGNFHFGDYSHTFSGFTGSIGATYNFTEQFSLKANISRGFRAPNIAEIAANGVHPGTGIYQIGSGDFKPEFSFQQDLGIEYTSRHIVATLSVFNNEISNYIYNQRLKGVDGGDSLSAGVPTYKFQQGKAQLYGGEFSLDIHPVKALHFENSISAVYALNKGIDPKLRTNDNKYLPFIPPVHGISELRLDWGVRSHHIVNGFAKVQVAWYASQNRAYLADNTESATPGYALINAGVGAGVTNSKGKTIFNLYIMGNNLFDVAYFDHMSRLKYFLYSSSDTNPAHGIHNMGRNIAFKIDFPLDFGL